MADEKYDRVARILRRAWEQCSSGKGDVRHATNNKSFEEQISCLIQKEGFDYARGQCVKKVHESLRMESYDAINELLGAINYLCIAIIALEDEICDQSNNQTATS